MVNEYRAGDSSVSQHRFAVIVSEYNTRITTSLHDASLATLKENSVPPENIDVVWVPGAWEIPLMARKMLEQKRVSAVVCLGCVIRGETTHDQHINREVSRSLGQLGHEFGLPVAMGVLTCNTVQQAEARAGGNRGNKGVEATQAVIDMLRLIDSLKSQ